MTMVGYPIQTDAEIDAMYESELARSWEEENAEPETSFRSIDSIDSMIRIEAFAPLSGADFTLGLILEEIEKAMDKIPATTQGDRLAAMYDELSDFRTALRNVRREIWRSRFD